MARDPLDVETSVSAELTESGIKASAKSRTIAAIDRLLGSFAEWASARVESSTNRHRSISGAENRLLEILGKQAAEQLRNNSDIGARATAQQLRKAIQLHERKERVIEAALDDLKRQPPAAAEASAGQAELDDAFIERLDHYSQFATTADLQERWGRVLASEIRKPGTFSQKVLRLIDELDADVAKRFEDVCKHRIAEIIPKCLYGPLTFGEEVKLVAAGLLVDPNPGQRWLSEKMEVKPGKFLWGFNFPDYAISVPTDVKLPHAKPVEEDHLSCIEAGDEGEPTIPVYVLTDEGLAIGNILADEQESAIERLAELIAKAIRPAPVVTYRAEDGKYKLVTRHRSAPDAS